MKNELVVKSNIHDYEVVFCEDFSCVDQWADVEHKAVIIDRNVFELYRDQFAGKFKESELHLFDALEDNKTLEAAGELYDWLTTFSAKRNLLLISVGGGITQDVTGFIASTLYRGLKWYFMPTTLLAQTDSCIGSKTSLNFKQYKNLLGTFYPPHKLYINPGFIQTLTETDFFSGVGELIKLQLMKEKYPKNLDDLKAVIDGVVARHDAILPVVRESLSVKIEYMKNDEFDLGRRNLLNYGHCFGHALETSSDYYVPHGIAVNIGMIFANLASLRRGGLSQEHFLKMTNEINLPNIPLSLRREDFNADTLLNSMKNDKKREGRHLALVLPYADWKLHKVKDLTENEFLKLLRELIEILFNNGKNKT